MDPFFITSNFSVPMNRWKYADGSTNGHLPSYMRSDLQMGLFQADNNNTWFIIMMPAWGVETRRTGTRSVRVPVGAWHSLIGAKKISPMFLGASLDNCFGQSSGGWGQWSQNVGAGSPHHASMRDHTQSSVPCRGVPTSSLRFHAVGCWAKIEKYVSVDYVSKWREADDKFKITKCIICDITFLS